jgi:nitronate monooxygenase
VSITSVNPLLQKIGVALPIVQAPMAGVSTPAMAAAVSYAGGLGSIGVGAATAEAARAMIREIRTATDRPFNVNVFCHTPAVAKAECEAAWLERLAPIFARYNARPPRQLQEIYRSFLEDEAMLTVFLEERPKVISFHFGLPPRQIIDALHSAGIVLIATATNLEEGRAIAAAEVDAVIAQGYEAGGHRGVFDPESPDERLGTLVLARLLVRALDIPVIAAGGIMDGAGIAACLTLGASAAQLGTAFVACHESSADAGFRAALLGPASQHTLMTSAISGRPARCLLNQFTELGETVDSRAIPSYPIAYDAGKALNAAAKAAGEFGFGAQWAGQGAPLARSLPAATLMAQLQSEMEQALSPRGQ